ncbi:MAG: 50S ribosomal protein L31e [Candidatus Bathyarchaeia archaeon]
MDAEKNESEKEATEEKIEEAARKSEEAEEVVEKAKEKIEPEKKTEAKEEIVEERIYTVPFGRAWLAPRKGRSPKAMRMLRSFIKKNMKIERDLINISSEVNEKIWSRGIEKPPRKIRIRAAKDKEGIVTVYLAEEN